MMKKQQGEIYRGGPQGDLEIRYTLTSDDIFSALKTSRIYRKNFIKAFVESGVLVGLVILFGIWWILWDDGNAMIFCIACACLIGLVWAAVLFSIRSTCNKMVTGEEIVMELEDRRILVGTGPQSWEIPLDGSVVCEEKNNILILYTGEKEWTLIPLKSIENGNLVREKILRNTKRLEKKR